MMRLQIQIPPKSQNSVNSKAVCFVGKQCEKASNLSVEEIVYSFGSREPVKNRLYTGNDTKCFKINMLWYEGWNQSKRMTRNKMIW